MLVQAMVYDAGSDETARNRSLEFGNKYGYSPEAAAAAPAKCAELIETFARRLEHQQALGSRYLVGDHLSAVDSIGPRSLPQSNRCPRALPDVTVDETALRLHRST